MARGARLNGALGVAITNDAGSPLAGEAAGVDVRWLDGGVIAPGFVDLQVNGGGGLILSLGHTGARIDQCVAAAGAGVVCMTHMFNAMSQLGSREPGVVGAVLRDGRLSAGLIGDLVRVHGDTIKLALAAKQGPGRVFLVSDAMAMAGTTDQSFTLNGRLTLDERNLAGADLDLVTTLGNLHALGAERVQALAMATTFPGVVLVLAAIEENCAKLVTLILCI